MELRRDVEILDVVTSEMPFGGAANGEGRIANPLQDVGEQRRAAATARMVLLRLRQLLFAMVTIIFCAEDR